MKKLLFIVFYFLVSCDTSTHEVVISPTTIQIEGQEITVYVIDSCEYIGSVSTKYATYNFLTHKGNCKFCSKRK